MGARIITDPRLLHYYLTIEEVASLVRRSIRSVQSYCKLGEWQRGTHWIKPNGGPKLFLRDGILRWLEEERPDVEKVVERRRRKPTCRANLRRSPGVAAAYSREVG